MRWLVALFTVSFVTIVFVSNSGCACTYWEIASVPDTFYSGEDRRVKKAFQAGRRAGVYSDVAKEVIRSTKAGTFCDRRAAAAKLRWAVRAMK